MACINCRQKKLKVHYRIALPYFLRSDYARSQCRTPDEIGSGYSRCVKSGVPCVYAEVNPSPTTSNAPSSVFKRAMVRSWEEGIVSTDKSGGYTWTSDEWQEGMRH